MFLFGYALFLAAARLVLGITHPDFQQVLLSEITTSVAETDTNFSKNVSTCPGTLSK